MANWDVFHSDRLELERALDAPGVLAGLSNGAITGDDLIRPAGSDAPWSRIGDRPDLISAASLAPGPTDQTAPDSPEARPFEGPGLAYAPTLAEDDLPAFPDDQDDDEDVETEFPSRPDVEADPGPAGGSRFEEREHAVIPGPAAEAPYGEFDLDLRGPGRAGSEVASSVEIAAFVEDEEEFEEYDPLEEDEAVAEFTLTRGRAETVEELDLAAMVDVAFQLVLFFLVTATTVLYKTLEVPKPNPESAPPAAATQGRSQTLDDLKDDYILVEVDPAGAIKVDREPVPAVRDLLVARLREARARTDRRGLLLSAEFATPHRNAVLVYDAANEAGIAIAIARPSRPDGP